ncbi:coenzyme F420-0:L-glutamate ligase [Brachybacterium sacelli]|uniref:Coenzyme F420-0:L-glutamate ligase/coenzyme F420-1:gamma-L-glutamate ligase n=1 Tax=Brachybacterium sacelli TaxID=173364 RepID=A0ABS4X518_9MICO|nr:coenzyme F420-0:L-glutamate ligase/coenzyme F420-1:gamma-L-glutamate ligase [Brachybacterium sacelli]
MTPTQRPQVAPSARPAPSSPPPSGAVEILPVRGIPEIREGDDLAAVLAPALRDLGARDGDVLCLSTKVVSKAAGLRVAPEEREAAVEAAAVRTVARRRHTRVVTSVVQIASGPVMAAAGVDSSNAPDGPLLLPEDPDASARHLRDALAELLGLHLGVLLTDTSSRIWRVGVGDIALGAAGVASLQDLRGGVDADGRPLTVTVRALADELAAAADLVKGKANGVPAALVRGVAEATSADVPARELSRTGGDDWFRRPSLESVWVALGLSPAQEPIARMSPEPAQERIARALAVAALPRDGDPPRGATARLVPTDTGTDAPGTDRSDGTAPPAGGRRLPEVPGATRLEVTPAGSAPTDWIAAGELAERIRTALCAEALAEELPPVHVEITRPETPEDPR